MLWYEVTFTLGDGTTEAMDFSGETKEQAQERALDYMRKENANPNRKTPEYTGFSMEPLPENITTDPNACAEYAEIDPIDALYDLYDRIRTQGNADDTAAVKWGLLTIEQNRRQQRQNRDELPLDTIKARLHAIRQMLNEADNEKILDMCRAREYHLYGTTAELKVMLADDLTRDLLDDLTPI